jgi:hypothetical protein
MDKLIEAVATKKISANALKVDQRFIDSLARGLRDELTRLDVGLRAYSDRTTVVLANGDADAGST